MATTEAPRLQRPPSSAQLNLLTEIGTAGSPLRRQLTLALSEMTQAFARDEGRALSQVRCRCPRLTVSASLRRQLRLAIRTHANSLHRYIYRIYLILRAIGV
jgi:hypothetical protein